MQSGGHLERLREIYQLGFSAGYEAGFAAGKAVGDQRYIKEAALKAEYEQLATWADQLADEERQCEDYTALDSARQSILDQGIRRWVELANIWRASHAAYISANPNSLIVNLSLPRYNDWKEWIERSNESDVALETAPLSGSSTLSASTSNHVPNEAPLPVSPKSPPVLLSRRHHRSLSAGDLPASLGSSETCAKGPDEELLKPLVSAPSP